MTVEVASKPEQVTPDWLTRALRAAGELAEGATVVDVAMQECGTGQIGDCFRIVPTYDRDEHGGPDSLVGKFPSRDPASRAFAQAEWIYGREVRFYQEVAPRVAIRTPRVYFAGIEPDDMEFLLLLEDLAPARECDQISGCTVDQAALALEQAAALHGSSWGDAELLGQPWLHSLLDTWRHVGDSVGELQAAFRERYEDVLEPEFMAIGDRLVGELKGWIATLQEPRCLWHCDYRLDNMLFDARDGAIPLAVVDWQSVAAAPGVIDASYFLGAGLTVDQRRRHEEDLVRHYHEALRAHGVDDYSWERCWEEYRLNAFAGFMVGLNASVQVKRTARGDEMFMTMARRHGAHILDSDSFALIPR